MQIIFLVKSRINRQITKIINDFNQNVQQENDIGRDLTGLSDMK